MRLSKDLQNNRNNRIMYLVGEGHTLTEICRDKEIVELFSSVKHLRERIRKIMTRKGYRVYKDYFIPQNMELNTEMKEFKEINYTRFSESEIRKLKNLVKRHEEIEYVLDHVSTKTIKINQIPENYLNSNPINKTIRVNEAIYNKLIELIDKNNYLKTLKKTEIFNIVLYEMIRKLEK